jgi:hypothetical protein
MNYQWSQSPLLLADPMNKLIAGMLAALALGSAGWCGREGDRRTAVILVGVGLLQVWAALMWN